MARVEITCIGHHGGVPRPCAFPNSWVSHTAGPFRPGQRDQKSREPRARKPRMGSFCNTAGVRLWPRAPSTGWGHHGTQEGTAGPFPSERTTQQAEERMTWEAGVPVAGGQGPGACPRTDPQGPAKGSRTHGDRHDSTGLVASGGRPSPWGHSGHCSRLTWAVSSPWDSQGFHPPL